MDAAYARRLLEVAEAGVEVLAVRIRHTPAAMEAGDLRPLDLTSRL